MLTQSLSTSVIGTKISPVAYPAPLPTSLARDRACRPHRHGVFLQEG